MSWIFRRTKTESKQPQAFHGPSMFRSEASKGIVQTERQSGDDRLPHPKNMYRYEQLNSKPEVHIAIELLTHLVAPAFYIQMPESEADDDFQLGGMSKKAMKEATVDPNHKNLKIVEKWIRDVGFRSKYQQIIRTKIGNGFCPVEILSDNSPKLLPPKTFYIHRDKYGVITKYTQEINREIVAEWKGNDPNIVLFIHNEDITHPYGVAISDSICDLIEARDQLNIDMPKIIHRFSAPNMIVRHSNDITPVKDAVQNKDVDEALFVGNTNKDEMEIIFNEPDARVKFTEYIELINFQIAEELHAPLILLLKNATEASATKMLESVDRYVQSEQDENAEIIEQKIFKRFVSDPIPEFLHGAPNSTLKEITLDQIGTLKGNGTITWKQAQDLIRKKGIDLIEDEQPEPPPIFGKGPVDDDGKPLLNRDKINQADASLRTLKDAFENGKILISEALKEGDRVIKVYVDKARREAHSQMLAAGKQLTPETEQHFKLIEQAMFSDYRNSLLPVGLRDGCKNS
jgi:hypothetical protein